MTLTDQSISTDFHSQGERTRMRIISLITAAATVSLYPGLPAAQHPLHPPDASGHHLSQPYAGMDKRPIKSLSEQQIADLQAGKGMSLALAAELNGYPGPLHVLEHSGSLALTPEQHERTTLLMNSMRGETIPLGHRYIAQEVELNAAFASNTVTTELLAQMTANIGQTQAALRAAHLRYHIAQKELLTPEQLSQYARLRGYVAGHQGHR
jgi:hypothetical protein